ncbi:unnamed protein product [Rhizophagus irregularis]|nr:unnamed protein product [Rhizophagus irregularis]
MKVRYTNKSLRKRTWLMLMEEVQVGAPNKSDPNIGPIHKPTHNNPHTVPSKRKRKEKGGDLKEAFIQTDRRIF